MEVDAIQHELYDSVESIGNIDVLQNAKKDLFFTVNCPDDLNLETFNFAKELSDVTVASRRNYHKVYNIWLKNAAKNTKKLETLYQMS